MTPHSLLTASILAMALGDAQSSDTAVPTGYVRVPGGLAHKSCTHEVPAGVVLDQTTLPICEFPFLRTGGLRQTANNLTHGSAWKAWAQFSSGASSSVTSLVSLWTVPGQPSASGGQVLFFWNGLEPRDTSAVLQVGSETMRHLIKLH